MTPAPGDPVDQGAADPPRLDPGLARERTSLAWTRTALSFAAVGGVTLEKDVIAGLVIMCLAPAVWQLGRLTHHLPGSLQLITATIVAVALVACIEAGGVALLGGMGERVTPTGREVGSPLLPPTQRHPRAGGDLCHLGPRLRDAVAGMTRRACQSITGTSGIAPSAP